ncbi:hypothetical protein BDA96_10G326000 [Sorghum bicolor]|jgi:hypothetical protein|uniref:Uncharacterized protein n=2 Tax=Sorghum bicolor TaxID=4558 RepID=A0A921Q6R8_SORBI|nr:hypothetical protein BDA96_10G326000 [Sorghum bicolor]KXG20775.1 hypothetical protein SORBI_3010G252000 [Sorghum bicolor]
MREEFRPIKIMSLGYYIETSGFHSALASSRRRLLWRYTHILQLNRRTATTNPAPAAAVALIGAGGALASFTEETCRLRWAPRTYHRCLVAVVGGIEPQVLGFPVPQIIVYAWCRHGVCCREISILLSTRITLSENQRR